MRTIYLYDKEITATYSGGVPEDQSLTPICQLYDAETTVIREELNGSYELEMIYVATGQNADRIAPDLILGAWVPLKDSIGENYFRIFRVEKDLGGRIYVYARNLASDLTYTPVRNNTQGSAGRFTQVATWALMLREYAMDNIPFNITDEDDISLAVSYAMPFKTVASALAYIGGADLIEPDKSMLEIFGGEIVFDKFAIKRYNERGTDRNTTVAYGVNMDNIILTDDLDEVYTAYVLYYADDQFQVASDVYKTVYADEFGFTRTALIDWTYYLTEAGYTTQAQILAALNAAAATYRDNHQDEPVRQIEVDVVSAEISDVYLGDHVPVTYYRHGENINARMKVVAYEWDVLMQRYNTLTLGAVQQTLAKEIAASNAAGGLAQSESGALASLVQRVSSLEGNTRIVELGLVSDLNIDSATTLEIGKVYHFYCNSSTANHFGSGGGSGFMFIQNSAAYGGQFVVTDSYIWFRAYVNSVWGAWRRIGGNPQNITLTRNSSYVASNMGNTKAVRVGDVVYLTVNIQLTASTTPAGANLLTGLPAPAATWSFGGGFGSNSTGLRMKVTDGGAVQLETQMTQTGWISASIAYPVGQ